MQKPLNPLADPFVPFELAVGVDEPVRLCANAESHQEAQLAAIDHAVSNTTNSKACSEQHQAQPKNDEKAFDNVYVDEDEEQMYDEPIWNRVALGQISDKEWSDHMDFEPKRLSPHIRELLGLIRAMEQSKRIKYFAHIQVI